MKKFAESIIGIVLFSIIPSVITYVALFNQMSMEYESIKPHLPIIISFSVLIIIASFLFIRKWFLNRIRGLQKLCNEQTNNVYTISKFWVAKHEEQFSIFADYIFRLKHNVPFKSIPKIKINPAEKELFNRLVEYEKYNLEEIEKLLTGNYTEKESEDKGEKSIE
jgi:hypothetical protein